MLGHQKHKINICLATLLTIFLIFVGCKLNNPFTPPPPPIPNSPRLISPLGDTISPNKSISFSWDPLSCPNYEIFRFQVSKSNSFSSIILDTSGLLSPGHKLLSGISDTTGDGYFWRVKVQTKKYKQWSDWSSPGHFWIKIWKNRPPVIPHTPSPDSTATGVSIDLALEWVSGDPDGDTVFYTVYFGKDSLPTAPDTIIRDSSGLPSTNVSYKLPDSLDIASTYYWKIIATDNWGNSSTGGLWYFTTETTGGVAPDKPSRPQSTPPHYVDEPVIFTTSTIDSNGDFISYLFDYGDGSATYWTELYASGQTAVDTHIYYRYGEFYVKVKAKDVGGRESPWSDPETVKVKTGPGTLFIGLYNSGIIKLSSKGTHLDSVSTQNLGALQPLTLTVDQRASTFSGGGDVWVASSYNQRVFKFNTHLSCYWEHIYNSPDDAIPSTPWVDKDGNCWFAFAWRKQIVKLDRDGNIIKTINVPISGAWHIVPAIAFDESRGCLWAVTFDPPAPLGSDLGSLFKFDTTGTLLWSSGSENYQGSFLDLDPTNGDCWAALSSGGGQVLRINSACDTINKFTGFYRPTNISVDYMRKKCWVSDSVVVVILDFDGNKQTITGFGQPTGIKVDLRDGSCWVSDANNNKVFKFDYKGDTLFVFPDIPQPSGIVIDYIERD